MTAPTQALRNPFMTNKLAVSAISYFLDLETCMHAYSRYHQALMIDINVE
jgi:hypothetical protein